MREVMIALTVCLAMSCGGGATNGANNVDGNNGSGACPSWSGTLGTQDISGNGVSLPPAPLNGITLLKYEGGEQVTDPFFSGVVSGDSMGKSVLMVSSGTLGGVGLATDGQNLLWDKTTSTVSGTVQDASTMEVLTLSISYANGSADAPPERCIQ